MNIDTLILEHILGTVVDWSETYLQYGYTETMYEFSYSTNIGNNNTWKPYQIRYAVINLIEEGYLRGGVIPRDDRTDGSFWFLTRGNLYPMITLKGHRYYMKLRDNRILGENLAKLW